MGQIKRRQYAAINETFRYFPFEYFLDVQKNLQVESVELWVGPPHIIATDSRHQDGENIRNLVEARGMKVAACTLEYSPWRQYYFCSHDPLARDRSIAQFKQVIDFTAEAGANILVFNCAGGVLDESPAETRSRAVQALRILADYASEKNVTLAAESLPSYAGNITNTMDELRSLLADVHHPALKVCLNTEAMCCAGETISQWFDTFGTQIVHVHFSDGKPSGRPVWGEGLFPLDSFLQELRDHQYLWCLGMNYANHYLDPADAAARNYSAFVPFFDEGECV